ncbi:hypothetical protein ElyMa_002335500 [Elysia marginata]|uniref:Uncharacterized protein n=1 Tax=Elysia marginata TaxID=1093978 RepID=A0AAV4G6J3_9GAST|nr:hypothetical protein ElyMa_002335500 [Elysia marginata]
MSAFSKIRQRDCLTLDQTSTSNRCDGSEGVRTSKGRICSGFVTISSRGSLLGLCCNLLYFALTVGAGQSRKSDFKKTKSPCRFGENESFIGAHTGEDFGAGSSFCIARDLRLELSKLALEELSTLSRLRQHEEESAGTDDH